MHTLAGRESAIRSIQGAGIGPRMRALLRAGAALILLTGAACGAWLFAQGARTSARDTPTLDGTWELSTLSGESARETAPAGLVSQRISLRSGRLRGETVLRLSSEIPSPPMPFPDQTVDRVISSADGSSFRVLWSGTYQMDDRKQMTLRVGKAVYFVRVAMRPERQEIEFNQDVILALQGAAVYRRSGSAPAQ